MIFLKYISDAFEELHSRLVNGKGDYEGADPEDPNEYTAERVFFVPPIARWKPISDNAKKTEILLDNGKKVDIGGYVDEVMEAIERQNLSLKGVGFWAAIWEFVPIKASHKYDEVVSDLNKFLGANCSLACYYGFCCRGSHYANNRSPSSPCR